MNYYLDKETFRRLLLALRIQLRGDVNLLLDTALDVAIGDPSPKPAGICRTCRSTWQTSVAGRGNCPLTSINNLPKRRCAELMA
jgi:hypothetical protein